MTKHAADGGQTPPDPERLRRLEEKLAKIAVPKAPSRAETHFTHANQAWRMVIELVSGLGIGFGIGFGLDAWLGTMPVFLVLFVLAGFVAGIKVMLRTAQELGQAAIDGSQAREDQTETGTPVARKGE